MKQIINDFEDTVSWGFYLWHSCPGSQSFWYKCDILILWLFPKEIFQVL